jgi:cytochrome P450
LNSCIVLCSPETVNECFVTKNKYFDKHPKFRIMQKPLLGDSVLFSESTELWSKKRKSLSSAFYKEKLTKMLYILVDTSLDYFKQWNELKPTDERNIPTESMTLITNCI